MRVGRLERHYRDMVRISSSPGRALPALHAGTRNGKRTAKAARKVAVDLAAEGSRPTTRRCCASSPSSLDQPLFSTIDPRAERDVIAVGLPASPGAATGQIVFSAEAAERLGGAARSVILVREETSPEDIRGMDAARGIVTARGGMTSHAAVVARGMGRPCVSGAGEVQIYEREGELRARGRPSRPATGSPSTEARV